MVRPLMARRGAQGKGKDMPAGERADEAASERHKLSQKGGEQVNDHGGTHCRSSRLCCYRSGCLNRDTQELDSPVPSHDSYRIGPEVSNEPSLATGAQNSCDGRAKKIPRAVKMTSDAQVTVCMSVPTAVDPDIHGFSGIFHDEETTPITDIDSIPRVLNKPRITKPRRAVAFTWQKQGCAAGRRAVVKVWMTRTCSRRMANNFVYLFFCIRLIEASSR